MSAGGRPSASTVSNSSRPAGTASGRHARRADPPVDLPARTLAARASLLRVLDQTSLAQVRDGKLPVHVRRMVDSPGAWLPGRHGRPASSQCRPVQYLPNWKVANMHSAVEVTRCSSLPTIPAPCSPGQTRRDSDSVLSKHVWALADAGYVRSRKGMRAGPTHDMDRADQRRPKPARARRSTVPADRRGRLMDTRQFAPDCPSSVPRIWCWDH